mmetsp:Transcript_22195/g.57020  ORF Transcript_22195/g.57020 Transcript_22195/m.57020 type:complete len:363 (-) Transcript_22195:495-1583(-)
MRRRPYSAACSLRQTTAECAYYIYHQPTALDAEAVREASLVRQHLLEGLLGAHDVGHARRVEQHLRALGEGVVVLRAHPRAVRARAVDHHKVAELGREHRPRLERLRLAGCAREQVARLAAVARDDEGAHRAGRRLRQCRQRRDRVARAVQRRPQQLGHARVQLEEVVAALPGAHLVLHARQQRARVGDEEGARLDLQLELAAVLGGERLERRLDGLADRGHVGRGLVLHAAHLEAAAQVDRAHVGQLRRQPQRQVRHRLPHRRVRARADVRVHALAGEPVLLQQRLRLWQQLVPDAERRGGPAHVGLARATRAHARVDAQPDLAARARAAEPLELGEGARVHAHAEADNLRDLGLGRELLR